MTATVSPRTRRNNLLTLVLLIVFALGLCAIVVLSMRVHARKVHEAERTSSAAAWPTHRTGLNSAA